MFDSGGRGDKSFNDSAYAGVEKAEKSLGIDAGDVKTVESKSAKDFVGNLSQLAESGCDVVFAIGIGQDVALKEVAPKYPEVKFGLVDGVVDAPNVRSIVFTEEQGSFLAGYAAALASKTGKVGFVGGKKIPLIEKFQAGYEAGAKTADPKIVRPPREVHGELGRHRHRESDGGEPSSPAVPTWSTMPPDVAALGSSPPHASPMANSRSA